MKLSKSIDHITYGLYAGIFFFILNRVDDNEVTLVNDTKKGNKGFVHDGMDVAII